MIALFSAVPAVGSGTPTPSPSLAPSPSSSPSGSTASADALQNKEAQGQIIADLTAAEGHAVMLERSLGESQANLLALGQQVADADRDLAQLDSQLAAVRAARQQATARLQADRRQLSDTVRRRYKDQRSFLAALLELGGFGGFLQAVGYSQVLLEREQAMVRAVRADEVALEHAQALLERTRAERQAARDQLNQAGQALAAQVARQEQLQKQLQDAIDQAIAALDAAQTDSPAAATTRAQLVKLQTDTVLALIEQAVWDQGAAVQGLALAPIDPEFKTAGLLLWPIPHAVVSQGFGPSTLAVETAYAGYPHFHTGIDLAVPLGTPVFAAADGVVVEAGPMTDQNGALVGYGNYVILQHADALCTLYAHLMAWTVRSGDTVRRGQLVGMVGSTGNSTGPHTHFEVRVDSTPVDPMQFFSASPTSTESVTH